MWEAEVTGDGGSESEGCVGIVSSYVTDSDNW